jgi:hypothetical protein
LGESEETYCERCWPSLSKTPTLPPVRLGERGSGPLRQEAYVCRRCASKEGWRRSDAIRPRLEQPADLSGSSSFITFPAAKRGRRVEIRGVVSGTKVYRVYLSARELAEAAIAEIKTGRDLPRDRDVADIFTRGEYQHERAIRRDYLAVVGGW